MALLDGTELENKFEDTFFENNRNENEVNYEWEKVRKELMADGVKAIKFVFEYYQQQNTKLDPWINFCLASSHFTHEELNGTGKAYKKRLEYEVKQLMKKAKTNEFKEKNYFDFIRDNCPNI
jgi:hypothetical protein